jgi:zinc/manganese transport system permease protein
MTRGRHCRRASVALTAGLVARFTMLKEDASLAAFYLISLALGVIIVSMRGSNVDLFRVLFGSVLALDDPTLASCSPALPRVTLVALALLWRPLVLDSVDPGFLRSVSRRARRRISSSSASSC